MQIVPDFSNNRLLEKYSSAFTLSDMEIFIFPELLFPLVLANIMSPIIWTWRDDAWFEGIEKKSFNYKANRIKQYIMDHYIFNLDLETWGLTNKDVEIERFRFFVDMDILRQSNALFGYEGDKYYFDMDIRRHFGLDKYNTNTIPYWKTETVEAMTAFGYKPGFISGAGECVSLSALYAAALFIVGHVPLENIFLIATPLHSQNFIDIDDGLITNNRRIVTKNMWFNGTLLTDKARRALEKEKVTIVSHISGYIHQVYETATICPKAYSNFSFKLRQFLKTDFSIGVFIGFLRLNRNFCGNFQYRQIIDDHSYYIEMERIFEIEYQVQQSFSEQNSKSFLRNIPVNEFSNSLIDNRIIFQDIEYNKAKQTLNYSDTKILLSELAIKAGCNDNVQFQTYINELIQFLEVEPRLPNTNKESIQHAKLDINLNQSREEIVQYIIENAAIHEVAQLSLYTYRLMDKIDWEPFIKAAVERNPISIKGLAGKTITQAYLLIKQLTNHSIYDSCRLALPDEVWNFQRGDGIEKAILLANFILSLNKKDDLHLIIDNDKVILENSYTSFTFQSNKSIIKEIRLSLCCQEYLCRCY